ncbi:hypothetical protein BDW22DRAFT_1407561 [Trametopsis cervina]|nr:hypothetical protein BDW22DRAFT_1407561 [Trametopsis cervina]
MPVLDAVKQYVVDRSSGLKKAAGYAGGAYLMTKYVARTLRDARDGVLHDRIAKDNLRRRFDQNQQDVSFTIMALLPTLGARIIEGMDVEGVTEQLQSQTKALKAKEELEFPPPPSESSASSSGDAAAQSDDIKSDSGSMSIVVDNTDMNASMSTSTMSWVDQFSQSSGQSPQATHQHSPETTASEPRPQPDSPNTHQETDLSDSIVTNSSVSYGDSAVRELLCGPSAIDPDPTIPPSVSYTRSKAELWKELKILTFTRTLTILYSLTLLSLFTHVQLNILGRMKYIQSVIQLARDELEREHMMENFSISSLFFGGASARPDPKDIMPLEPIDVATEMKYLTLSWWILHVGWKDVGERVRRAVEEVFEGVSLKTKLASSDLHRLLNDVRRRVEFEVTFEGTERRIKFTSTLLPPTQEMLQHVLTQGGIPSHLATSDDPEFRSLLLETRTHLSSGSFERVLESCLDRASDILFRGLEKNVFAAVNGGWDDPNSSMGLTQEPRVRLAGMLPGLARWCHLALEGLPNEVIDGLADVREVSALSAIIYSDYDDLLW